MVLLVKHLLCKHGNLEFTFPEPKKKGRCGMHTS